MGELPWIYDDGGRAAAGFTGPAGDCVVRAIAIAADADYRTVYDAVNSLAKAERPRAGRRRSSSRTGVSRRTYHKYLTEIVGWTWTPTMGIGTGTTVHLRAGELPPGPLVVRLSRHLTAVINGVVRDTHNPGRAGSRCVYGYYQPPKETTP